MVPLAKTIVTALHDTVPPVKSFRAFTAVEGFGAAAPPPPALGAEEAFGAADAAGAARARFRASTRFSRRTDVGIARVRQRRVAVRVHVVNFIVADRCGMGCGGVYSRYRKLNGRYRGVLSLFHRRASR